MLQAKKLNIIKKRSDFLAIRNITKQLFKGKVAYACPFFLIQKRPQNLRSNLKPILTPCFGFTVSKKNGKAIIRNKIKRRLKEAIRTQINQDLCTGYDYIIIGKKKAFSAPFPLLIEHLKKGLYP